MMGNKSLSHQSEAALLKQTMNWLNALQRKGVKPLRINDMFHKGYADIFVCVQGKFVILELKTLTGAATPHQELFIKEMLAAGAIGGVCRCFQDVENYIKEAFGGEEY